MTLIPDELAEIELWAKRVGPLSGTYFRSVEYRFMNPDEVLNGRGTQLYGNRFAKVGTRAVYLADSDRAASNEVLTRKKRLGGKAQITLDKYPRKSQDCFRGGRLVGKGCALVTKATFDPAPDCS